jgi:hypothetical protein
MAFRLRGRAGAARSRSGVIRCLGPAAMTSTTEEVTDA